MPVQPENNPLLANLQEFDPEAIEDAKVFRGELTIYTRRQKLRRVCEFLRDAPHLRFQFLSDITAVDLYPKEPRFEVVYHLLSLDTAERVRLKVRVSSADPQVNSMV